MTRRRVAWLALAPVALLGALAVVITFRVHRRVLASLTPPRLPVGAPAGLPRVDTVRFTTGDGVELHGWYVPSRTGAAVILGHGWAGQRGTLLPEARALAARGLGVLLFDWRGHGESGGARTTWGVDEQHDLDAAIGFVSARPDVDPQRVGALGFSMGGMVVAQVAERDPRLRAVAVEGAFTSLEDELRYDNRRWGWWSGAVSVWTVRRAGIDVERERPVDALCRISPRPLLVVAGTADGDLPVDVARRMVAAACTPKALVLIPNATHATYAERGGADFARRLADFFEASLAPSASSLGGRVARAP